MSMNPEQLMMMQQMMSQQAGTPDPTMGEQSQVDPSSQPAQESVINPDPMAEGMPQQGTTDTDEDVLDAVPDTPDPVEVLPLIIADIMDYTSQIRFDETLAEPVKAKIILDMSQAMNYLVPLLPKDDPQAQVDAQLKQMEFQLKQQEMEFQLQMKAEEHQMNLEFKRQEMQLKMQEQEMKLEAQRQQNEQKIKATAIQTQQKIVQSEQQHQQHQQKIEQQKQASQSKQSSNPSNKEG